MHRLAILIFLLIASYAKSALLFAQVSDVQDSLELRLQVISQLSQAGSFEQAQVESEGLRTYLKRTKRPVTPQAVKIISGIYKNSNDETSATRFLTEAELDARRDLNPATRTALLITLVTEYRRWGMEDQALTCRQLLVTAQDSLASKRRRGEMSALQHQLDSVAALRQEELGRNSGLIHLEREQAYMLAGLAGLILLLLLYANYRNTSRWKEALEKRELEWELMRANLQQDAEEKAAKEVVAAVEAVKTTPQPAVTSPSFNDPFRGAFPGEKPDQLALIIEPNRQIILYIKSLLSDRFQVETAYTPNEGLQMAAELMPDLVVCDAILNGTTGIEVARKIKLSDRTNHIPVVLLTDKFGNEGKLDALRAGADAWFSRPVLGDDFNNSVKKLLESHKVKHEQFNRFLQLYFTDSRIPLEHPFLVQTVQFIEQNLSDPNYMADDMARKMQMTKLHFTKKLKVLTGKEPVQLIRELRLEKAKVLLERRAGTPQAISNLVGFSNPGTFAMAFKDYFGENTSLLYSLPPRLGGGSGTGIN